MDRKLAKKKWPPRKIALVGGTALLVLAVLYMTLFADRSSRLNVDAERVAISPVVRGPFQEFIPVNGTVQPIQTFYLDATEGGRVESRYVEAGAMVKQGDPILKLNNANLQLDVSYREALSYEQINNARNTRIVIEQNTISVRAQLADVEYQHQRAVRAYRRDSLLFSRGMISDLDFKQSRDDNSYWSRRLEIARESFRQDSLLRVNQIGQINASIARLEANLDMIKQNLDALVVRAPISGQLSSLNAEIGQSKSAGERLGQIDVLDSFKVRAGIDEFYISRIKQGQTGEFDFVGSTYQLTISKVYPEVRDGRFEVDMLFAKAPPQGIRRGQTLQIRLELGDLTEALLIPRGGFYQKTGGQWIYVVDRSGAFATKRPIKLGRQNPQTFEVLDGLEPGEQVITSSYENFGDIDKLILKK
ncbi:MAG TPA: HlyD family efflux transporter periplasmic adaptor subunit [Bacteroidota bacterium]